MPSITIAIPHQFDRSEARRRTEECVGQFRQQYGNSLGRLEERWTGDTMSFTFAAMGQSISGKAFVEDRTVRVEIDLPWVLSMLSGTIKQSIESHGRKLLEAKPAGGPAT